MNIENEVFKRANADFKKLEVYGFKKYNKNYVFEKNFLDADFKAIITINDKGIVSGKVIDLVTNLEYTNIRTEINGTFVNKVRESYKEILIDIRNKCFETNSFLFKQSNRLNKYIENKYHTKPEFLWNKFPGYAIYRKKNKWFALIGNVKRNKVNKNTKKEDEIEILNVKVLENELENYLSKIGYYEAYHMNKKKWISIILDDTLKDEEIISLLDKSYDIVSKLDK